MSKDSYQSFHGATRQEVLDWIGEIGCGTGQDPMEIRQNDSPTVGQMLKLADPEAYADRVTFTGYTIRPPRADYRVSLDGYMITGLSAEEAEAVIAESGADEKSSDKAANGSHSVTLWWD